jgi:uncharacterized protein
MIRVVVDTNIVISGTISEEGLPSAILDLAANRKIRMIISADVLFEYEEVLRRPRFKIASARIAQVLALIRKTSTLVNTTRRLSVSPDESDNRFYECAHVGKANYLITGNTKDFPVHYRGTKIVTPREFIEWIGMTMRR